MDAKEAIDQLHPQRWAATPAAERLHLLEEVRDNIKEYADELAAEDARMKNGLMGEELFSLDESMVDRGAGGQHRDGVHRPL
jgi:acyl-CoA reductase-like NAD-dependent aldehyde dehydrogenase